MSINKQLEDLYKSKWNDLVEAGNKLIRTILINDEDIENSNLFLHSAVKKQVDKSKKFKLIPSNPLLLKVNEELFDRADLKVMIFGQETFGWHEFGIKVEAEMNSYEKFFNNGNVTYKGNEDSSFWKAFRWFRSKLEEYYKSKDIVFIWNNISKLGRYQNKVGVPSEIKNLEQKYFHSIIKEEISIIDPDMIIFLTGDRDEDIKFNFKDVNFEDIHFNATLKSKNGKRKYKKAQQIILNDFPNIKCVKTYHPTFFGGYNNIKNDALTHLLA